MSIDKLAGRLPTLVAASPEEDRRRAAEDRREAAQYLSDAYRDDTTGALNRRPGREQIQVQIDHARRDSSPLSVIFADVDGLKDVNDSQGHDKGDRLLGAVGQALRCSLRSYDVVVRYGGDEFVCALPGGTSATANESLARARAILDRLVPGATFSAGRAELRSRDTMDQVILRADRDLYEQRRGSRDHPGEVRRSHTPLGVVTGQRSSVACGACGGRIALEDFILDLAARMTRTADCSGCGATTLIQLARGAS